MAHNQPVGVHMPALAISNGWRIECAPTTTLFRLGWKNDFRRDCPVLSVTRSERQSPVPVTSYPPALLELELIPEFIACVRARPIFALIVVTRSSTLRTVWG